MLDKYARHAGNDTALKAIVQRKFMGRSYLKRPSYYEYFRERTFQGEGLTSLILGEVTETGPECFSGEPLKTAYLINCARIVRSCAFKDCADLERVYLGPQFELVEDNVFENCTALVKVSIPITIKTIDSEAFKGCTALERITFRVDLETFFTPFFDADTNFVTADEVKKVPYSATKYSKRCINTELFEQIINLKGVPDDCIIELTGLREFKFKDAAEELSSLQKELTAEDVAKEVVWKSADTIIEGVTKLIVAEGVTEIPPETFKDCQTLREVIFPTTLEFIDNGAFLSCSGLESIVFQSELTNIQSNAFEECILLKSISTTLGDQTMNNTICVKFLQDSAFKNCRSLKQLELKNTTFEGPSIFSDCHSLEKVILPAELQVLPRNTFRYCMALRDVQFSTPQTLKVIGLNCFYRCYALEATFLSTLSGLNVIDNLAFAFTAINRLELFSQKTSLRPKAFYDCSKLTTVHVKAKDFELRDNPFDCCISLTHIIIKSEYIRVTNLMLTQCYQLRTIDLRGEHTVILNLSPCDSEYFTSLTVHSKVLIVGYIDFLTYKNLRSLDFSGVEEWYCECHYLNHGDYHPKFRPNIKMEDERRLDPNFEWNDSFCAKYHMKSLGDLTLELPKNLTRVVIEDTGILDAASKIVLPENLSVLKLKCNNVGNSRLQSQKLEFVNSKGQIYKTLLTSDYERLCQTVPNWQQKMDSIKGKFPDKVLALLEPEAYLVDDTIDKDTIIDNEPNELL